MDTGVVEKIGKASWLAESLSEEANGLLDKARDLSADERKELPRFRGLWKEKEIRNYLNRLEEALKKPRLFRSRRLLEGAGFSSEGVPADILEETGGIKDVVVLLEALKEIDGICETLQDVRLLSGWLNDGISTAKGKLQAIIEAKEGFKRVLNLQNTDEGLKTTIIKVALGNPAFIQEAEELDSQMACIKEHGILVTYDEGDLDAFTKACGAAYESLSQLENIYRLPISEVDSSTKGKSLPEANELLRTKVEEAGRERGELIREWRGLAQTLHSLGREVPDAPDGIPDLKQRITQLEDQCREDLGESGQELLSFLIGKCDFPDQLSTDEIRVCLEKLRPFIAKNLGGAEWLEK